MNKWIEWRIVPLLNLALIFFVSLFSVNEMCVREERGVERTQSSVKTGVQFHSLPMT